MTSETDKQIERLEARMSAATVEEVSTGLYEVFVPGAAREVTVVKADSEDEAKQKVQSVLANKIQHTANKKTTGNSDGTLDVQGGHHGTVSTNIEGEA